jgi:hypothetical protein
MSVGSINFIQTNTSAIQYLRGPQNSNLLLNGDFTIEFYINCTTEPPALDLKSLILSQYSGWGATSNSYWIFIDDNISGLYPIIVLISGGGAILTGITPVNNNLWNHVAIVRNGMGTNNVSLFINGVLDATTTNTTPWDYSGADGFCIASNPLDNFVRIAYQGFISNLRIVNGTAVYTSNFTPSTTNLTAIPGTALLLNTAFDSPFLDSSPNNLTITPYNSPTASNETPMSEPPVPCFKADSKILVYKNKLEQYIKIQDLRRGDLVKTLDNGYVPINMIGKKNIVHSHLNIRDKNGLYKCTQENYPEVFEDLIITGCHSILVDCFLNQEQQDKTIDILGDIYITDSKYRLPACLDERAIIYENEGTFTIYHIALDNENYYYNYGIYANGLLVESCSKRYLKELSDMELI